MSVINTDHMGWLKCDGRSLNTDAFYFLFSVIGYSFGGSGSSFNLPNPAGRVPGVVGTGTDINTSSYTLALGSSIGEYEHKLTIPELASHNHGVDNTRIQSSFNNSTSQYTHSHDVVDPGHNHELPQSGAALVGTGPNDDWTQGRGNYSYSNYTGITLADNTHAHTLNPAGGDKSHNNVQPTIGMGHMYIYCGLPNYPGYSNPVPFAGFPYQTGSVTY